MEATYQTGGCEDHQGVDDEQKDAEGENADGYGNDLEYEADGGVEQADDERGYKRCGEAVDFKAGNEFGGDDECDGAEQPVNEKPQHSGHSPLRSDVN